VTDLFGEFGFIENININQAISTILQTDGQIYSDYVHPLSCVIPDNVTVMDKGKNKYIYHTKAPNSCN
jgi:hypothetical protein